VGGGVEPCGILGQIRRNEKYHINQYLTVKISE
jgi:hypothetical protein